MDTSPPGRLRCMPKPQKYRDVVKVLRANGWVLLRTGRGSHELWGPPDGSVHEVVSNHGPGGEISAGVVGKLLRKLPTTPDNWR
jgi:predicted RNA binding protein YcfA (HicA-like mRNA interferase family)